MRDGLTAGEQELRDLVRGRVADYKTPQPIIFLPVLPKGLPGKVQRRALKDLAVESGERTLLTISAELPFKRSGCQDKCQELTPER